jgi:uncharacterized protein
MKKKNVLVISVLLSICLSTRGQEKEGLRLIANGKRDSIQLRWAPSTPFLWQTGNRNGYILERLTYMRDGKVLQVGKADVVRLNAEPIKPYSQQRLLELAKTNDRAAIVAEAIYGKKFEVSGPTAAKPGKGNVLARAGEVENRFGFSMLLGDVSPDIAKATGLYFVDRNVKAGERYIYRVRFASDPKNYKYEQGSVVLEATDEMKLQRIQNVRAEFSNLLATIEWPVFFATGTYTAYSVERSLDGKTFKRVTELPIINATTRKDGEYASFMDSLQDNTTLYHYRVRGISPFGEMGPPSEVIKGKGKEPIQYAIALDTIEVIENKRIRIGWRTDNQSNSVVKGFQIYRSTTDEGPYMLINKKLLPPASSVFVDEKPDRTNYYRIKAVFEDSSNSVMTFSHLALLEDLTPPAPPIGLKGSIDSLGIAKITWTGNKESDFYGYRVFRANALKEEFVEISRTIGKSNEFKDTLQLNTLTKNVYYKVVAMDKTFNNSDYSEPLGLKKPDTVSPAPPLITLAKREGEKIHLKWIPSPSDDVATYTLYREEAGAKSAPVSLATWPVTDTLKERNDDKNLVLGKSYTYILEVADSAGNTSRGTFGEIYYETGYRDVIDGIKTKIDRENHKVVLSWTYAAAEVDKYIIYRAKEGQPMIIYNMVDGKTKEFTDTELLVNNNYVYKLQAVFSGGMRSKMSSEIKVKY